VTPSSERWKCLVSMVGRWERKDWVVMYWGRRPRRNTTTTQSLQVKRSVSMLETGGWA
jgi:hypothetical protein